MTSNLSYGEIQMMSHFSRGGQIPNQISVTNSQISGHKIPYAKSQSQKPKSNL